MENIEEILKEKLDSFGQGISEKLDSLFKRVEALENPPNQDDDEESVEKTDAKDIATKTLREKLDGFLPKEKLDALDLLGLSQAYAQVTKKLEDPNPEGIINSIGGSTNKLDALKKGFEGKMDEVKFE